MTQSVHQLLYGICFMVVGCIVSESISAQNKKKSVTDGQTDKLKTISFRFAGDNVDCSV